MVYPIVDAIQEFKIESNSPPAEFAGTAVWSPPPGRAAMPSWQRVRVLCNENLNATNYFQASNAVKPTTAESVRRMLGGPLVKDWTFFFVDYQVRQSTGAR